MQLMESFLLKFIHEKLNNYMFCTLKIVLHHPKPWHQQDDRRPHTEFHMLRRRNQTSLSNSINVECTHCIINVTEQPDGESFPSVCPESDLRGSSPSPSEPANSITWAFPPGTFCLPALKPPSSLKVSSDWPPPVWRRGRSAQRREQAASTVLLRQLESPAKPSLLSAGDPGNKRVEVKSDALYSFCSVHQLKLKTKNTI